MRFRTLGFRSAFGLVLFIAGGWTGLTAVGISGEAKWLVRQSDMARSTSLAISPDSKIVAHAGYTTHHAQSPYRVEIRDLDTGKILRTLDEAKSTLHDLRFSEDGKYLYGIRFKDSQVMVWDTGSYSLVQEFPVDGGQNVRMSPDNKYIAIAAYPGEGKKKRTVVVTYDRVSGQPAKTFLDVPATELAIQNLVYTSDGKRLLASVQVKRNGILAFDTDTGKEVFHAKQSSYSGNLVVHEGNGLMAIYEPKKNLIHVFQLANGKLVQSIPYNLDFAIDIAFHPGGEYLIIGNQKPKEFISFVNIESKAIQTVEGKAQIWHLRPSPDGKHLAYVTFFSAQFPQNISFAVHDMGDLNALSQLPTAARLEDYKIGHKVLVNWKGDMVIGFVAQLGSKANQVLVEFPHGQPQANAWVPVSSIRFAEGVTKQTDPWEKIAVGITAQAWVSGRMYRGKIQSIRTETGWVLVEFEQKQPKPSEWVRPWHLTLP